jgi:hypothetical protein
VSHIPLSEDLCRKISDKAVQHARQDLQGRGWKSATHLVAYPALGRVGIKTSVKYLMYQESGIKPFLMTWVDGKTLPMKCAQGDGPHFRRGGHVGEPGMVDIPHRGKVFPLFFSRSEGAIVMALRDALQKTTLFDPGQAVYIDLEYPMRQVQYPGIWVQFSTTKLNRSGIGHEVTVQDPDTGVWSFVQEWTFLGRVTLTIAALRSIDRDRLADALIANIAFARPPNLLLTQPQADTKQYRSLITALDENPYVSMTLNTDTIVPGGQTISMGTPWKDDELTYEDNYSFDLVGQFNLQFSHDGVYSLAAIEPNLSVMNGAQPYNPSLWLDAIPSGPVGGGLGNPGGTVINPNITIPAF